jgi:hypothetical protein
MWMETRRGERESGTGESAEDPRDLALAEPAGALEPGGSPEPGGSRGPADASAYWRRRFFILCGGVAALGLSAWLFPGGHETGQPSAAARASMAALATQQALPAAATGKAWAPSPAASPAAKPAAGAQPTRQKISLAYHPRAGASASAAGGGPSCTKVVLSLSTSQPSYSAGERPGFKVYAVSTAKGSCTLRYGAGSVQVVVTRQGRVVWNSAACKPRAAKPVTFTPGVPHVLAVTWNRGVAGPAGCAGSLPAGTAATLNAVVLSGGKSSPVTTFKIRPGQAAKGSPKSQSGKSRSGKSRPGKSKPAPSPSGPSRQYKPR